MQDKSDLPGPTSACVQQSLPCMFDDEAFKDVTFKAGEMQVQAHKVLVAAQSPVLRAMFQIS